ncbi:MAG TPA: hypothetical protein VK862_14650, partial [Afifellaceae bacterium]|nr:hypothetical protein [Afifellaceae bacterium]
YGVPPRPRPEAIHFSSSTASAVSDYGFSHCERLRKDLLASLVRGEADETGLRRRAIDATGQTLCAILGMSPKGADAVITPSGTDAELQAVMIALAGAGGRPLTNILIAPEETGRGVKLAASGRYFDDIAATGAPVGKGMAAWPDLDIHVEELAIRDADATPRPSDAIDTELVRRGRQALERGHHVLVHVLAGSKTGLTAPSHECVETLVEQAPDRVDVVVDACQMRSDLHALGGLVDRGWMVQISGSKFLTGPPFSGALMIPTEMRRRIEGVGRLLAQAPGTGRAEDWTSWWATRLPVSADPGPPGFGSVMRWFPAVLEAQLLAEIPEKLRRWAFERFRSVIIARLAESRWLRPIDLDSPGSGRTSDTFSRLSIVSFEVLARRGEGKHTPLDEASCRSIFELLNVDSSRWIEPLATDEVSLARQPAHIGQPVALATAHGPRTVLRMVLGARFFTFVGFARPSGVEAALESEISDALRAIAKLELLASRWAQVERAARVA